MSIACRPRTDALGALARWGAAALAAGGSRTPRLDAELLLACCAGTGRAAVLAFPERAVAAPAAERYRALIARRAAGEPVAYLIGCREFYSLPLMVTTDTLVPRPETELLVEQAVERLPAGGSLLDLGTGSGAIALAVKQARPDARVTAADVSAAALAVAAGNGRALGLAIRWLESDWFSAVERGMPFDLIAANPPYVASDDPHFDGELRFEPRLALDGGSDGCDALRAVIDGAPAHLGPGGLLLLEHGYDQGARVRALLAARGFRAATTFPDLAGRERVSLARWPAR